MKFGIISFALGLATIKVIGQHTVADGDIIYHVEDLATGQQDFVSERYITFTG